MSLMSSAPFSNVTTYKRDFDRKTCPRAPRVVPVPEFKNPISGPAEQHFLIDDLERLLKEQREHPTPVVDAEQTAEECPRTRTVADELPDIDVIRKLYENDNRSTYMVSYCLLGDFESKTTAKRRGSPLPDNWVIPLTTQRYSYRNPYEKAGPSLQKSSRKRPKDNLAPNEREREILEVKTGETIYMSDIGNTGTDIIEGKLHGDVNVRPQFNPDDLLRAKLIRTD